MITRFKRTSSSHKSVWTSLTPSPASPCLLYGKVNSLMNVFEGEVSPSWNLYLCLHLFLQHSLLYFCLLVYNFLCMCFLLYICLLVYLFMLVFVVVFWLTICFYADICCSIFYHLFLCCRSLLHFCLLVYHLFLCCHLLLYFCLPFAFMLMFVVVFLFND